MVYPEHVSEKAYEAGLVMKIASLKMDLIIAEEELQRSRKNSK